MEDQAKGLRELVKKRQESKNSKFITVASGKGGVGKTNFSVNFAYALANSFNKKVLLIDADIGMANIHILLNKDPSKNIKNLFYGAQIEDIIVTFEDFDAILGFSGIESLEDMSEVAISMLINQLESISYNYEYIIIDTGAGIDERVASFSRASNETFVITTSEPTALMDAYALIKSMHNLYRYSNFKVVMNMSKNKEEAVKSFSKLKLSAEKYLGLDLEMIGYLPFSQKIIKCIKNKELILKAFPSDPFSLEMKKISALEAQEDIEENSNFWRKVFNFLGQKSKI